MNSNQRKTLQLALRILGRTGQEPTNDIRNQMHGITMLAINLNSTSVDLLEIDNTANHLYLEMD